MYREFFRKFDWVLFIAVFLLVGIGLATIYSVALSQDNLDFLYFKKQLIFVAIGLFSVCVLLFLNYTLWRDSAWVIYGIGISFLVLVLFFGKTIRGTSGWFSLGGINFQPVEFVKLALILISARFFVKNLERRKSKRLLVESFLIFLAPMILAFLQPDFGSVLLMFALWAGLVLVLGVKKMHLVVSSILLVGFSVLAWNFLIYDYQKERVLTFLDPSRDPFNRGYNLIQSIIAVGSGQIFGRGLGFGAQSQLRFLPEAQTDFIFAVIAEELGFVAVLFILGCFAVILYRALMIGYKSGDNFAFLVSLGVAIMIFTEVMVNIGMNLGIFPVAGLTLPFLSYGGSSLLAHMAMFGILQSIALRR
jgi:rod shape determining protein RodA